MGRSDFFFFCADLKHTYIKVERMKKMMGKGWKKNQEQGWIEMAENRAKQTENGEVIRTPLA